ncbi:Transient receptor potential cation channel subfamily M member 3 [Stylophora pistillata]|uniref:Transient receptor potential cation channel subfamily M member 3 n=1 Tax=Stylophora pistillata TaxID=50429 RepID=A0A2B4RB44_STYPI|nr:Transient receptor potential cation channel subfamily M member 3 [Stylophora pistillata]
MRHVGEAVKGHTVMSRGAQLSKDKTSQLHLIGIATWGIVNHREDLIDSQGVVTYHMTSSLLSEGACLDNNHSHFILVDDGTVGKYGGEIPFRAGLQNCISTKKMERSKSHGIPVVLLVLEGGPNTIQTVLESVTSNPAVPVVIAEGSGRAADILAHAHGIVTSNEGTDMEDMSEVVEHQQLLMKIQKAFPECNEEKCTALYHNVLKCVEKKRYLCKQFSDPPFRCFLLRLMVHGLKDPGPLKVRSDFRCCYKKSSEGFELDIKLVISQAQHASAADQLSLALIWNRADIAKTEIFTEDQKWKMKSLEDAMTDALVNNRVEFVKLLLENGVSMSRFLTTTRLEELYKARWRSSSSAVLRQLIGNGKIDADHFDLSDVDNVIRRLLAIAYKGRREKNSITKVLLHFDFMNHTSSESDTILILREFKRLALDLLEKCFQENEELTQQLLTYHLENWGGQTCLSLAVAVEHEEFLAHSSCQALLTDIWTGAIKNAHRSSIKTMLGILIPPTIFLLAFKTKQELSSMPVPQEEYEQELTTEEECEEEENEEEIPSYRTSPAMTNDSKAMELRTLAVSRELHRIPTYHVRRRETRVVKLRWTRKILEFYKAPVTKFWSNVFAYMAFLVLFSFVILVKQDKIPSISEMVLIIFVCTLCTEEIRQTVDMLYFLLIMVIFLLAYGVAQQAILYPNEIASWSTVSGVFFRPYFQVYGELFFDEPDTISPTETVLGTPRKDKHGDTIVVLIMAFYLLVANILLLNLLIAIFNNTFSSVQANANQIWKFQRYYLVMEYAQRPVLVPPFIILNHVIHILRGLYRWLKSCLGRGNTNHETSSYGLSMAFLHG